MKPTDLVSLLLGIGSVVVGATIPATSGILVPTGVGLIAGALPQLSQLIAGAASRLGPPAPPK